MTASIGKDSVRELATCVIRLKRFFVIADDGAGAIGRISSGVTTCLYQSVRRFCSANLQLLSRRHVDVHVHCRIPPLLKLDAVSSVLLVTEARKSEEEVMRRKARSALYALVGVSTLVTGVAFASRLADDGAINSGADVHGHVHSQHGGGDGHLAATSENVKLIGKMNINQDFEGRVSDVGVHGNYAYLGAFNERDCQKGGVYVFDISKPAAPKQINFIRAANNSYVGEGVQVISVNTEHFKGDLLLQNNEICGTTKTGAKGGISLIDVTNPKVHKYLAEGVGDFQPGSTIAQTVHSVFAWQANGKAYAVMTDNEEAADVDIMDISDPRNPVLIAEYNLAERFPQIVQQGLDEVFLHDMVVKEINGRQIMLLAYWDAGYVTLDVTDPTNATFVADSQYAAIDPQLEEATGAQRKPEGNGHQAEFSTDNAYVVATDEDFSPYASTALNVTDNQEFSAAQGSDTPKLAEDTKIEGQTVFVGRACTGDPAVPEATGANQIAVVERGMCTFTEKISNVDGKGYAATIIFNRATSDGCNGTLGMLVAGNTITFGVIQREVGFGFFGVPYDNAACLAGNGTQLAPIAIGTKGDTVSFESYFDGWGYVHLFRNGTGNGGLEALDTYAIPEAHNKAFASGSGDLSVHEVAMSEKDSRLAYFAYYAGGFRVAKIQNDKLVEVGHFIDQGGNNFWGVQLWEKDGKEYVLASDRDYGVYIFEYTGN